MTHEEFSKIRSLDTAIRRASAVLHAITVYKQDKDRQGMHILLNHELSRSVLNIVFPEIENEVLDLLEKRYNQLMTMWVQELNNLRGEVYGH